MESIPDRSFFFLFRTDRGLIDRGTWWRGTIPLVLIAGGMTGLWLVLRPYARHDLSTSPFLAVSTVLAFVYLAVFTFALILIAVCEYNLSAKRFRDRGRPAALASVLPLTVFAAAALIWFIPRSFGEVPDWGAPLAMAVVALVAGWNLWDLGFGESRSEAR